MRCSECEFESNCSVREIAPDITGCNGHSKSKKTKAKNRARNKKFKSIWMCCNCRARIKMITGEAFEKPRLCECGSKDFK